MDLKLDRFRILVCCFPFLCTGATRGTRQARLNERETGGFFQIGSSQIVCSMESLICDMRV